MLRGSKVTPHGDSNESLKSAKIELFGIRLDPCSTKKKTTGMGSFGVRDRAPVGAYAARSLARREWGFAGLGFFTGLRYNGCIMDKRLGRQ